MFNFVIVMYVLFSVFCVLFGCKCALYYCHQVSTHLWLNIYIYNIIHILFRIMHLLENLKVQCTCAKVQFSYLVE
jgi:hypothetical protein